MYALVSVCMDTYTWSHVFGVWLYVCMYVWIYAVSWVYDRIGRAVGDRMVYGEWENLYICSLNSLI